MASLGNITFACKDPWALAEFWAAALKYGFEEPPPEIIEAIEAEAGDLNAGTSSVDDLTTALELTFEKLRRLGLDIPEEPDIMVQNIVTNGDLGTPLNLNAIAIGFGLEAVEYEPEQFPRRIQQIGNDRVQRYR